MLYGCKTWPLRVEDQRRLEVFDNDCLRRILGRRRLDLVPHTGHLQVEFVFIHSGNLKFITKTLLHNESIVDIARVKKKTTYFRVFSSVIVSAFLSSSAHMARRIVLLCPGNETIATQKRYVKKVCNIWQKTETYENQHFPNRKRRPVACCLQ